MANPHITTGSLKVDCKVGDNVMVFCRDVGEWFHGQVVALATSGIITAEYVVNGRIYRKAMARTSKHFLLLHNSDGSNSSADNDIFDEVDPRGIGMFPDPEYRTHKHGGLDCGHLGRAYNLCNNPPLADFWLFEGNRSKTDEVVEDFDCTIVHSEECMFKLFGMSEGSGDNILPLAFGHALGVGNPTFYASYLRKGRARSISCFLCRSTFNIKLVVDSLVLKDGVKELFEERGRTFWDQCHGDMYVNKIFYGGMIQLEIKVEVSQEVNEWELVLNRVTKLIKNTFEQAAEGKKIDDHNLRLAWNQYTDKVQFTVSAKSSGVTPSGFGLSLSLPDLVQQIEDFRCKVDQLPHDAEKCTTVAFSVQHAQSRLATLLPQAALSHNDHKQFLTLLAKISMRLHRMSACIVRLDHKLHELRADAFRDWPPLERRIDAYREHLDRIQLNLKRYMESGPASMLANTLPQETETSPEFEQELKELMGNARIPASELVGKAHPEVSMYAGHVHNGQPIYRGALLRKDASVWAAGYAEELKSLLEESIERYESYPNCMKMYDLLLSASHGVQAPGKLRCGMRFPPPVQKDP